jgi:hypothetical protein
MGLRLLVSHLLAIAVSVLLVGLGKKKLVTKTWMWEIFFHGVAVTSLPPTCNRSFSFIGGVGKKKVSNEKLGCEKYLFFAMFSSMELRWRCSKKVFKITIVLNVFGWVRRDFCINWCHQEILEEIDVTLSTGVNNLDNVRIICMKIHCLPTSSIWSMFEGVRSRSLFVNPTSSMPNKSILLA